MAAPVLESISRDVGAAAGGTTVILRGYGFIGGETATFGGNAATVVAIAANKVTVTAPAGSASETAVDVVLTNANGSSTLSAAYEYAPAITTTYANVTFEDGTLGALTAVGGTVSVVSVPSARGTSTKCAKCAALVGTDSGADVELAVANNPPLNKANGLWTRCFLYLPNATLTLLSTGQIKLFLCRVAGTIPETMMLGVGPQFSAPNLTFASFVDNGISGFTGTGSGQTFGDAVWGEVLLQLTRNSGASTGRARMWLNGKKVYSTTHANIGANTSGDTYTVQLGIVFTQAAQAGTLNVYVDTVLIADGFAESTEG